MTRKELIKKAMVSNLYDNDEILNNLRKNIKSEEISVDINSYIKRRLVVKHRFILNAIASIVIIAILLNVACFNGVFKKNIVPISPVPSNTSLAIATPNNDGYIKVNVISEDGLTNKNEIIPEKSKYGFILNKYNNDDISESNNIAKDNISVLVDIKYLNSLVVKNKSEMINYLEREFLNKKKIYFYGDQDSLNRQAILELFNLNCPFDADPVNKSDYSKLVALSLEKDETGTIIITDYLNDVVSSDKVTDDIGFILSTNTANSNSDSIDDGERTPAISLLYNEHAIPAYTQVQVNNGSTMLTVFAVQLALSEVGSNGIAWEVKITGDLQAKGIYKNERIQLRHAPFQYDQSNADGNNRFLLDYWPTDAVSMSNYSFTTGMGFKYSCSASDVNIHANSQGFYNNNEISFEFLGAKRSKNRLQTQAGAIWANLQGDFITTCHGTFAVNSFDAQNLWDIKDAGYNIKLKDIKD